MKHVLGRPSVHEFLREVESSRQKATGKLDPRTRGAKGQFFTPVPIAMFMASLFDLEQDTVYLLDAGAGVGSLTAAVAATLCTRDRHPSQVVAAAFENDPVLTPYVTQTLERCRAQCQEAGIRFVAQHAALDFIDFAVYTLSNPLLMRAGRFDAAILNPPYRKINSDSDVRQSLRLVGIETSNLYAAFLAL